MMFFNYAKTKAMYLLHDDQGSTATEFGIIVVALTVALLPSVYFYADKVKGLFLFVFGLLEQ